MLKQVEQRDLKRPDVADQPARASVLRLFIPDKVPLGNKGEEAIIRGIEDLLAEKGRLCELAVFDRVEKVRRQDNIHIFPLHWNYPNYERRFGPDGNAVLRILEGCKTKLLRSIRIRRQRCGFVGVLGNLARSSTRQHSPMRSFFDAADLILLAHDGVFCHEHCGVLLAAKRAGKRAGILGAGGPGFADPNPVVQAIYRRAVYEADFFVVRERGAYEHLLHIGCDPSRVTLAPDPAFAMKPAAREDVQAYLENRDWYIRARTERRLLVAATVCHKLVLLRKPFGHAPTDSDRVVMHTDYLAAYFKQLVTQTGAIVCFLPHSLEPGQRNDLAAARGVIERMGAAARNCHLLTDDLPARFLKGLISEFDFLIGQRAHSLIGGASVATPYVALTASDDSRTHQILGDMLDYRGQMIDMDSHNAEAAFQSTLKAFQGRNELRSHLAKQMSRVDAELARVRLLVHGAIG